MPKRQNKRQKTKLEENRGKSKEIKKMMMMGLR
jgi:hypothetical protein